MKGRLIVLEGLDGSGKATQAQKLARELELADKQVCKISFPDYSDDSGGPVRMYLNREFGDDVNIVNPYAASVFFTVNRYASFQLRWKADYLAGKVMVADRYATSNAVHQMCKLKQSDWDEFLDWLCDFEYTKFELPKPDLVIYLDVDPALSAKLLDKRYAGKKLQDLHEGNIFYLKECRKAAFYAAKRLGWVVVKCYDQGHLFSMEEIAKQINQLVFEFLEDKRGG